jgi:hypothetical protein
MSVEVEDCPVAKKESKYTVTKVGTNLLRDARIVCSITGEALQDYLTRILEPIIAKDKDRAFQQERMAKEQARPKKKTPPAQ